LQETLADVGAGEDDELLASAQRVVDAVKANAPEAGPALGIDLDQVEAEFLRVQRVRSEGTDGPANASKNNEGPGEWLPLKLRGAG
jgi:hypothetical protein